MVCSSAAAGGQRVLRGQEGRCTHSIRGLGFGCASHTSSHSWNTVALHCLPTAEQHVLHIGTCPDGPFQPCACAMLCLCFCFCLRGRTYRRSSYIVESKPQHLRKPGPRQPAPTPVATSARRRQNQRRHQHQYSQRPRLVHSLLQNIPRLPRVSRHFVFYFYFISLPPTQFAHYIAAVWCHCVTQRNRSQPSSRLLVGLPFVARRIFTRLLPSGLTFPILSGKPPPVATPDSNSTAPQALTIHHKQAHAYAHA